MGSNCFRCSGPLEASVTCPRCGETYDFRTTLNVAVRYGPYYVKSRRQERLIVLGALPGNGLSYQYAVQMVNWRTGALIGSTIRLQRPLGSGTRAFPTNAPLILADKLLVPLGSYEVALLDLANIGQIRHVPTGANGELGRPLACLTNSAGKIKVLCQHELGFNVVALGSDQTSFQLEKHFDTKLSDSCVIQLTDRRVLLKGERRWMHFDSDSMLPPQEVASAKERLIHFGGDYDAIAFSSDHTVTLVSPDGGSQKMHLPDRTFQPTAVAAIKNKVAFIGAYDVNAREGRIYEFRNGGFVPSIPLTRDRPSQMALLEKGQRLLVYAGSANQGIQLLSVDRNKQRAPVPLLESRVVSAQMPTGSLVVQEPLVALGAGNTLVKRWVRS